MSQGTKKKSHRGTWITSGLIAAVLVAMGFGTTVIPENEVAAAVGGGIDPATFAEESYDGVIVEGITKRAHDLTEVAEAIKADPTAAATEFAVGTGPTATYSVTVTGIAGTPGPNGHLPITVEGLPEGMTVAVQTGPALMGTALRDATGEVTFEKFTNQLDFQAVGDKLNAEMKKRLIEKTDLAALSGTEVTVVGAMQPLNPAFLLLMPVSIKAAQ